MSLVSGKASAAKHLRARNGLTRHLDDRDRHRTQDANRNAHAATAMTVVVTGLRGHRVPGSGFNRNRSMLGSVLFRFEICRLFKDAMKRGSRTAPCGLRC
jgi:hypothetical protein